MYFLKEGNGLTDNIDKKTRIGLKRREKKNKNPLTVTTPKNKTKGNASEIYLEM